MSTGTREGNRSIEFEQLRQTNRAPTIGSRKIARHWRRIALRNGRRKEREGIPTPNCFGENWAAFRSRTRGRT